MNGPPVPTPIYTCWLANDETTNNKPMARVRLDVGQYSFQAGKEVRDHTFAQCCSHVIAAIEQQAIEFGWIKPDQSKSVLIEDVKNPK